jgi:hypothetical protein
MKRLFASAVLLSATLVATTLFVGMSPTVLAAGTLTVEKPYDNTSKHTPVRLVAGFSYFITWTPGNAGATVKIELLRLNKRYKWISKKTKNDGEYIWKIPKSVAKGSMYKIRITSSKNSSISDKSNGLLTILRPSRWWKEDFSKWPSVSLGIEDDGAGTWGNFMSSWDNPANPYHVGVVGGKHPRRAGKQSFRFEVRPGQCGDGDCTRGNERSELGSRRFVPAPGSEGNGSESWYAWSIYFQNYKFADGNSIHGQFGQKSVGAEPSEGSGGCATCILFFILDSSGNLITRFVNFEGDRSEVLIPREQLSNKWHDVLVHAKWSTGADGLFKVWVDGKLKLNRRGANLRPYKATVWFKFGVYRHDMSHYPATTVVYYDELVRGSSCEDVSQFMTCPGGGSLKVTSPNGKEKWKTKKKYTIKWKKGKAGTYVKIQLLKKGKLYKTIAAKTKNDGKHAWRVPSTLVKSAAYKVKITSTKNKKLNDSSDKNFTITK